VSTPTGGRETAIPAEVIAQGAGPMARLRASIARFTGWFGPGEPPPVLAPPDTPPRSTDYLFGFNLPVTPRAGEPLGFAQLRALSDATAPRALIETVKDQMARHTWTIRPVDPKQKAPKDDPRIKMLTAFFESPDREHDFTTWQRELFEDMLAIDAATVYLRRTRGGKLYAAEVIDGATIRPLIDQRGRYPEDGPAFRQVVHGLPAIEFTQEELIYAPRNPRPHKAYGFGPVEQALLTVNVAIRRELSQTEYFTDGTIPDALYQLPDGTSPSQAEEIAKRWSSFYDGGNTAERRRLKFVPPGTFIATKQPPLKDEFDEYYWRVLCFFFSVPPTAFIKQTNRACHSDDTEVLTDRGWLRFPDLAPTDRVATFNPASRCIEYHVPLRHYVYPYRGEMIRYLTKNVDVLVTPEHEMWGRRGGPNSAYEKFAAARPPTSEFRFVAASAFDGEERATVELPLVERHPDDRRDRPTLPPLPMDSWLEFLGYYISEGGLSHQDGHYLLTLAQKDGLRAETIQRCLEQLPFGFSRYPEQPDGMVRWNVYGKQLHTYLREHVGGYCHDKRIPRDYLTLSRRQLRILLEALMLGDGFWDAREGTRSGYYATSSRQLADDVQELAFKVGYCASLGPVHHDVRPNRRAMHRVNLSCREEHCLRAETWVSRDGAECLPGSFYSTPYEGNVYCVEVPNHIFVTRRNGKIGIHGNTGQIMQDTALEEGLLPRLAWFESFCRRIIVLGFGITDLCLRFEDAKTPDETTQAKLDETYLRLGVTTINEVRERKGMEPLPNGNEPLIYTSQGAVKLVDVIEGKDLSPTASGAEGTVVDAAVLEGQVVNGNGNGHAPAVGANGKGRLALPAPKSDAVSPKDAKDAKNAKVAKRAAPPKGRAQAKRHSRPVVRAERTLATAVASTLHEVRATVLKAARARLAKRAVRKKEGDADTVDAVLAVIAADEFAGLVDPTEELLNEVATVGAAHALATLQVTAGDAVADLVIPNDAVLAFARDRAAELVGMRREADGTLVPNPNAEWAIDEGTRTLLRGTLTDAFAEEWTKAELTSALEESYAFSEARAQLIARTEVSRALVQGNLATYKASGLDLVKTWVLGSEHDVDDECDENAASDPVALDDAFPTGDDAPPAHPNCTCDVLVTPAAAGEEE
jgi:hypothetical protein